MLCIGLDKTIVQTRLFEIIVSDWEDMCMLLQKINDLTPSTEGFWI